MKAKVGDCLFENLTKEMPPQTAKVTCSVTLHHKKNINLTLITEHFDDRAMAKGGTPTLITYQRVYLLYELSAVSHCVRPESLTDVRAGLKYTAQSSPRGLKIVMAF